jgi:hypothetical protein
LNFSLKKSGEIQKKTSSLVTLIGFIKHSIERMLNMYKDDYVKIAAEDGHINITKLEDKTSCSLEIGNWIFDTFYIAIDGNDGWENYGWGYDYNNSINVEKLKPLTEIEWARIYKDKHTNKMCIQLSLQCLIYLPMIFYQTCCAIREGLNVDLTYNTKEDEHEHKIKTYKWFEEQSEQDIFNSTQPFPEFLMNVRERMSRARINGQSPQYGNFDHFVVKNGLIQKRAWRNYNEKKIGDNILETPNYAYPVFPEVATKIHEIFNTLIKRNKFKTHYPKDIDGYNIITQIMVDSGKNINSFVMDILMMNIAVDEQVIEKINLQQLATVLLPQQYNMWDYIDVSKIENNEFTALRKRKCELAKQIKEEKEKHKVFKSECSTMLSDEYNEIMEITRDILNADDEEIKQELLQEKQEKRAKYSADKERLDEILSTQVEERKTIYAEIDDIQEKMDNMLEQVIA